jgi:hypothetical protein
MYRVDMKRDPLSIILSKKGSAKGPSLYVATERRQGF